jgi:hypothetical protein
MNRRFFWQVPEYIKFRIVFETDETILGAAENNEYRLFRKDTNQIVFSICEAMEISLASLHEKESESLPQEETARFVPEKKRLKRRYYGIFGEGRRQLLKI